MANLEVGAPKAERAAAAKLDNRVKASQGDSRRSRRERRVISDAIVVGGSSNKCGLQWAAVHGVGARWYQMRSSELGGGGEDAQAANIIAAAAALSFRRLHLCAGSGDR